MANEVNNFNIGGVDHEVQDIAARQAIASLQSALDALTSGDTTTAIETFQEVIDFLSGVTDNETLIGKLNALNTLISDKVDKVTGKGLSTNDFTTEEKSKLAGIASGATANIGTVTGIQINGGQTQNPTNGVVNLNVESGGLDESDFNISSTQDGTVVFTIGEDSYTINLNHSHPQYVVTDELDDYILAGTNVTITKDAQTGALTISASGGGTFNQVQANWNESDTTSAAYIQNKPTIPDVSGKADKSEMSVTAGTGANADKTTIQLKSGTTATVLTTHQSLSGYAKYVLLADEAAYTALATKDSDTLYLIPES